ncbi:hypothetical protein [Streptoalloteichus tenebrarius]|uniref:hypothetical protein n=1 Tax=Streptoalloteichus tenebrarius (strain ATCC 17920 / DSM 40477 / JCM 4838 / CBS 697.72 / NBRC 16177 / NCIMB 11028 / NRRL B-12390 / A12253. 1 / ISP 5477) TaxID=1933 RepID=UPI00355645CD
MRPSWVRCCGGPAPTWGCSSAWAAALWVGAEVLRAHVPFGGFPWGKVAFGQADGVFLPLAAVGGTALLSFAVALCGFGLAALARTLLVWRRGLGRSRWWGPGLAAVAPVLAGAVAGPRPASWPVAWWSAGHGVVARCLGVELAQHGAHGETVVSQRKGHLTTRPLWTSGARRSGQREVLAPDPARPRDVTEAALLVLAAQTAHVGEPSAGDR